MPRTTLRGLLGVARAPFLPLAVLLALTGSLAQATDGLDVIAMWLAVVGMIAAHVLANVLNELADDASGLDHETVRTPFSGGSGALQAGLITRAAARRLAFGAAAVALAVGGYAVGVLGRIEVLPVIAVGGLFAVAYTPWLLRIGVGELAAGLGLGGLPVLGAALLQGGALQPAVIAVAAFATCATFNLLLLNTVPDIEPDLRVGRRSLVHRIGVPGVARLALLSWALATLALGSATISGALPSLAWLHVVPAVVFLGGFLPWLRAGTPTPMPLPVLGANVVHNLGTHAALVVGLGLGSGS